VLLIFFIVHGFVVNNAVLLCGFKQTKGKRYENSDSFDRTAAGIGHSVCVNYLWPVEAGGGGMTKDEALDLALEELENCADLLKVFEAPLDSCVGAAILGAEKAITAIKQELAQPVQSLPFGVGGGLVAIKTLLSRDPCVHAYTAIEMLDAILKEHPAAQPAPVQEPVAWPCVIAEADFEKNTVTLEMQCSDYKVGAGRHWLHTTPPAAQRQWVGLTDEERGKVYADWRWSDGRTSNLALCEHIEAKLKEKNT
jgi:hypothetical protein